MDVSVNIWAVIVATIVSTAVGSIWYSQKVFGKVWINLARIDMSKDRGSIAKPIIISMIATFISAYVLAYIIYFVNQYFGHSYLEDAVTTAFWLWLGLTTARVITHDVFEGRPTKLTVITMGHELVSTLLMGVVIGLFGV